MRATLATEMSRWGRSDARLTVGMICPAIRRLSEPYRTLGTGNFDRRPSL